jgi:hypothetical protein
MQEQYEVFDRYDDLMDLENKSGNKGIYRKEIVAGIMKHLDLIKKHSK